MSGPRPVRAARGTELSARGWQQEAALRMLQNNLDPEVAEHPDKLVVYGGNRKAARDWRSPRAAALAGMAGAQPLAVTMSDGVAICIDCDPRAIERRIEHRSLDVRADSLQHALQLAVEARDQRKPLSIGLLGNAAELLPQML